MSTARFITSEHVQELADPGAYIDPVRSGYRERGNGAPAEPRTALFADSPAGMLTGYLAILPDTGVMGGYTYAAGFGSADAHFALPLFDAESGEPLALLDGASMNPYKTGATGAVGVDALARDVVTDLAVIGSGVQARGQVLATTCVRSFDRVRVYSPTATNRQAFATEMNDQVDAAVTAVESASDAVTGADVVITATTASEPVFDGNDLDDGTHVTAMGQYHPKKRELDTTTIERATYVPDLRARVTQDAGSFLHAMDAGVADTDDIHAELGEVLVGDVSGRKSQSEITVFDSGGTAIETVAAGKMLYDRAVADGVGEDIEFAAASDAMWPSS